jgi:hypothetical protein
MSLRRTKSKVAITLKRHFRNTDAYLSRRDSPPRRHPSKNPGSLDFQGKIASRLAP